MAWVSSPAQPRRRTRLRSVSYRRIAVCLGARDSVARSVELACRLAGDSHSLLIAIAAIEVPLERPLDALDRDAEAAARDAIHTAQAIAESYGVRVEGVVLRARDAGEAIVAEVTLRRAEAVIVPAEWPQARSSVALGHTTDYVLRHAPCRVMLIGHANGSGSPAEADPVFRAGHATGYWPTGEFVDRV